MCRLAAGRTLSRWAATIEKSPSGYVSRDLYLGLSGRAYWYGTREEYDGSDFIQEIEAKRLEGIYIPKWHMQN